MMTASKSKALLPLRRRYQHSAKMDQTNFAFGDDPWGPLTIYDRDYTGRDLFPPGGMSAEPICRDTHMQRLIDLNKLPGVSRSLRPEDLDPALPPQTHQGSSSELQERRRLQRRTNFKFGNDPPSHITSYTEFAQIMEKPHAQKPCSPPLNAEIVPIPLKKGKNTRSTLRTDHNYFGPVVNENVYKGRYGDLQEVKNVNTFDSVNYTLLGKHRAMLTRSMVDYLNPKERVRGNPKLLRPQSVNPAVKMDSVWHSVNFDEFITPLTEKQDKFKWHPLPKNVRREKLPPVGR